MTGPSVLVVDDRPNMLRLLAKVLRKDVPVLTAGSGEEALTSLDRANVAVVLCDLRMPDMDGLSVLRELRRRGHRAELILMTAYATVDTAVEAMRLGAYDYLAKPFEPEDARAVVLRALAEHRSKVGTGDASPTEDTEVLPGVFARSEAMREVATLVRRAALSSATVLLLGETGTGKERLARALHALGPRAGQRFIAVNCAAIPAELLESELFGYAKGAFTGAGRDRKGLFEEADGGTLFLDEIGDLRASLQAKLTRVLEERAVRRIGEAHERPLDVRLVAATHRDIEQMVSSGAFREDLWYRLNVATIRIPPLRDRPEDVRLLAEHFLSVAAAEAGTRRSLDDDATAALLAYHWPGNVRQLRAAIERAVVLSSGEVLSRSDLPAELRNEDRGTASETLLHLPWAEAAEEAKRRFAKRYLEGLLRKHEGRVTDAAAAAGVERESFYRLMRRHGVDPP